MNFTINVSDPFAECKWCKHGYPRNGKPVECRLHKPPVDTVPDDCVNLRIVQLNGGMNHEMSIL